MDVGTIAPLIVRPGMQERSADLVAKFPPDEAAPMARQRTDSQRVCACVCVVPFFGGMSSGPGLVALWAWLARGWGFGAVGLLLRPLHCLCA